MGAGVGSCVGDGVGVNDGTSVVVGGSVVGLRVDMCTATCMGMRLYMLIDIRNDGVGR